MPLSSESDSFLIAFSLGKNAFAVKLGAGDPISIIGHGGER